jgi:hypothetical protein
MDKTANLIANGFVSSYRDALRKVLDLSAKLSDEQFWTRPYPYGNSFGHLTLHLIGNLNYYIGAQIANTEYVRDRDREFNESSPPSKEQTLTQLEKTVDLVIATIEAETVETLATAYQAVGNPDFIKDRFSIILRCTTHFHHHVGQMIYLEKELAG